MSAYGTVHLAFAFLAILSGGWVLRIRKGTRWHRTLGHAYVWSMVGVVVTSFLMWDLTGRFTPFHFAAIVGGLTLVAGVSTVLRRRPAKNWIEAHAYWMAWSYIGLMAAFAAESLSRFVMPLAQNWIEGNGLWGVFWASVGLATFAVVGVGWLILKTYMGAAVAAAPETMRQARRELEAKAAVAPGAVEG